MQFTRVLFALTSIAVTANACVLPPPNSALDSQNRLMMSADAKAVMGCSMFCVGCKFLLGSISFPH